MAAVSAGTFAAGRFFMNAVSHRSLVASCCDWADSVAGIANRAIKRVKYLSIVSYLGSSRPLMMFKLDKVRGYVTASRDPRFFLFVVAIDRWFGQLILL